jgi:hypothetical protein
MMAAARVLKWYGWKKEVFSKDAGGALTELASNLSNQQQPCLS